MANSDKNIVITPNISQAAQPSVVFKGQGNVPITLRVLDDSYGTLSFEGSAGQLFSINNNLTSGIIFSVNDVSGIPQIDVNADGTIRIAPFSGTVQLAGLTVGRGAGSISTNTALGVSALNVNTSGTENTAVGWYSLIANTTGLGNSGFGSTALTSVTTGNNNTALGRFSLGYITTTSGNTAVGVEAGRANTSGTSLTGVINSVYVGYLSYGTNSATNEIVIGSSAYGKGSNSTVLGNTSTTQSWIYGTTVISNTGGSNYGENLRLPESSLGWSVIHMGGSAAINGTGANQWSLIKADSSRSHRFELRHNTTEVITVLTGGSVGIGTTGPTSKFQVNNSGSTSSPFYVDAGNPADCTTLFAHTGANTPVPFRLTKSGYSGNAGAYGILDLFMDHNVAGGGSNLYFSLDDSAGNITEYAGIGGRINSNTNGSERGDLYFYTMNNGTSRSERMVLRYDGNLGIGTTNPGHLLQISGANENSATYYSQLRVDGTGTYPQNIAGISLNTSAAVQSHIRFLENGTVKAQIRYNEGSTQTNKLSVYSFITSATVLTADCSSNNVGIGTYSPNRRLVIAGNSADPQINIYKSPDGTINAAQMVVSLGTGSSQSNSGTTGGNEYGILQLYHAGTVRCQLYAYPGGNFVLDGMSFGSSSTPPSQVYIAAPTAATTALIVRGFTSQTAPLTVWQNSSGALLDYVSADGNTSITNTDMDWTPNYSGGVSSPSSGTFQKTSGNNGQWDAQVYSSEGFTKSAHVTFKASQINAYLMVGLNSDPSADAIYSSIDYAIYCHADNYIYIYENGAQIGSNYGIYSTSTVLSVVYDGVNVTYYKDGTIIRQVARAVGNALYLDSSFYTLNGAINSVKFGPALPNVGAQGTANYLAKFSTANSLVNSSIQDTGSGVIVNSVATPRYYSVSVNAGNATRLGQWFATEGNVALMIQVSSDTGGNSGTSTYLYNGGFNVAGTSSGVYAKLLPLMIGRGHGNSADSSVSSTDAGGWTVFLYTGTTNAAYTMGVAVGVATGLNNKALRITVTELRGGMTYTADGSSISYPTTGGPGILQHTYGAISSAGTISCSGGFTTYDYVSQATGWYGSYTSYLKRVEMSANFAVGNYLEIFRIGFFSRINILMTSFGDSPEPNITKSYTFISGYGSSGSGILQPHHSFGNTSSYDVDLEYVYSSGWVYVRARRTASADITKRRWIVVRVEGVNGSGGFEWVSGTGTSALSGYLTQSINAYSYYSAPPPALGTGAGTSVTLAAASAVGTGAGGSIILQPGAQATSGGNGSIEFKDASGTTRAYIQNTSFILGSSGGTDGNIAGLGTAAVSVTASEGYFRSLVAFGSGSTAAYLSRDGGASAQAVISVKNWGNTDGSSFAYKSSTPSAFSTDQNNLALSSSAFQRLSASGANRTITGIAPPTNGSHVDGRMMRIYNVGTTFNLILAHNSTSSTDVNRMFCVGQAAITIAPYDYAELIYDSSDNGRGGAGWRVH